MIKSIQIENFKSLVNLSLELGSFNVLIGENGSGKSNILEAIAFGAAASSDKLDYEFLGSRGIRATNPEFMFSAFKKSSKRKKIALIYKTDDSIFDEYKFHLSNDSDNPKKWINELKEVTGIAARDQLTSALFNTSEDEKIKELKRLFRDDDEQIRDILRIENEIKEVSKKAGREQNTIEIFKFIFDLYLNDRYSNPTISDFIIYGIEQSNLRRYEETNQIYPLGIKGEGLFQYLKELSSKKRNKKKLTDIKKNLLLLDWYENFDLPENSISNEFFLNIKDKYIDPSLKYFDQRSTNEGFLFLLFYSTLFISKDTPSFFAIDNIDTSLNPKLCVELIKNLTELAIKNKKQVIVTTQNPAVLDGLNLKDEKQRLFVVRRNEDGHTKARRITYKAERKMKLSEVWTNGFIGGLPDNF